MGDSLVPGDELAALNLVQEIIQEDFKEAFWNRNRYHRILYVGFAKQIGYHYRQNPKGSVQLDRACLKRALLVVLIGSESTGSMRHRSNPLA